MNNLQSLYFVAIQQRVSEEKEEFPAPTFGKKTKIFDFISELQNYLQGI